MTASESDRSGSDLDSSATEIPSIQRQPREEEISRTYANIPDTWSSIEELLGGKNNTSQDSITVQPVADSQFLGYEPVSLNYAPSEAQKSTNLEPQSKLISNNINNSYIQANSEPSAATTEEVPVTSEEPEPTDTKAEDETDNLELLAREIYHLLRQRLEVERERTGKYYSGRFNW
jgi:hypothetical protein